VKVLFDQGTPLPLRRALTNHVVESAYERGWSNLQNGELIEAAEQAGFEVLVTTDSNLKYQQNLANRKIAIVVLLSASWPRIQMEAPTISQAIAAAAPGSYREITVAGAVYPLARADAQRHGTWAARRHCPSCAARPRRHAAARSSARTLGCAVQRRCLPAGANPVRQLSLRPEAIGATVEVTKPLKPSV